MYSLAGVCLEGVYTSCVCHAADKCYLLINNVSRMGNRLSFPITTGLAPTQLLLPTHNVAFESAVDTFKCKQCRLFQQLFATLTPKHFGLTTLPIGGVADLQCRGFLSLMKIRSQPHWCRRHSTGLQQCGLHQARIYQNQLRSCVQVLIPSPSDPPR